MGISRKLRFEVFKRDAFTCQYCGCKAPDVVLQVDHIKPKSKAGTDDILNLVTSCSECNAGKSNRELSDHEVIRQKRKQLEELQARKEQLEMMFEWQKGLLDLEAETLNRLASYWTSLTPGFSLNDRGRKDLRQLLIRFGAQAVMAAMKTSAEQYLQSEAGKLTQDSVELAWKRVGGICRMRESSLDPAALQQLFYIRGILRNHLNYIRESQALHLLRRAAEAGVPIETLQEHAKVATAWDDWVYDIERLIEERRGDE